MSPVCAHCGELYPEGRLACPHCGADEEAGWSGEDYSPEFDLPDADMGDQDYEKFLEAEGLAAPAKASRPRTAWVVWILILAAILLLVLL